MLYVSRIKMRSFKSFKYVDINFPPTFVCLAGPNGSGKSNICDAIRFVLGEISLKSLRAKKVRDLIFGGAETAEVTIYLDGDAKIEIKRAIRKDGKILYRLNGKKTTRTSILETLKNYDLDESGRNLIAQGEVQRIINMNGKERRQIIDSVSGISDFENKKNEALRELESVDNKVKEGNLVLGEKMAFVSELEKERATAIEYTDIKKTLYNSKASLLKVEMNNIEMDLNHLLKNENSILDSKKEKESLITSYEVEIAKCEKERMVISKELQEKQQTSSLIKEIETYKASVGSKSQILTDKEEEIKKISANLNDYEKQKTKAEKEVEHLQEEIKKLKNELKDSEAKLPNYKKSKTTESLNSLEGELKSQQSLLQKARETLIALETDVKSKKELLESKLKELEDLSKSTAQEVQKETELDDEIESLRKDLSATNREIEESFKFEKELNSESAESDKRLLELREKYSVLRMQAAPALANPALKSIEELKESGSFIGIHGIVADLIKFDTRYTAAVEAAAGPRLLYVVVDSADVASKIIKHLKKSGVGRATFIPLREIRKGQINNPTKNPVLINLVSYSKVVSNAIDYVFGETVLVESMDEAKKIGVGNIRMVTVDGEIFEKSGIISGGRVGTSILAATQLSKLETEITQVKERKNQILKELTSTREDASRKRAFKAELELKIKTLELEIKAEENKGKLEEVILNRLNDLKIETLNIQNDIKNFEMQIEKINLEKTKYEEKLSLLEAKLKESIEKAKELSDTENKMITELSSNISSLRAVIEGKNKEVELAKGELSRIESDIKHENLEKKNALEKIDETKKLIQKDSEELTKCEEQISAHSKKIERLFENLKKFDENLRSLAEKKAKVKIELDKVMKETSQYDIKKATLETRLQDTKAEFSNFKEFDFIELSKEELQKRIKQSEQLIEGIGNVNMMAIEMYDKKKAEADEIKEKIGTLEAERSAVLQMITEIDHKKNEAFFETFYAVSDNFKSMFSKISIGEGFLYLDKPNTPFESGLYIKIKRNNREHNLDSLSGGENTLVALMFIFALQFFKPSPFYILDEVEAALDKENSKNLAKLIKQMAGRTQFILVSHNDNVMATADSLLGVTKVDGHSRIVGIKLEQMVTQ